MAKTIKVRASINLPGVPAGSVVRVNPDDEYMRGCLDAGYLVPVAAKPKDKQA